jgi:TolB-like protein
MKGRAIFAALCAIAAVHVPSAAAQPGGAGTPHARILVMPFDNIKREGRLFWLTEASAVQLADDLNALGASAIAREERLQAFDRLKVPPAASLSDATVIRIGQLVGAAQVILGSLQLEGETLVVRARSIALDTGRVKTDVTARGPIDQLFPTFEHIARQIFPSTRSSDELQRSQPAMPVFENYIKGLLAETPATAPDSRCGTSMRSRAIISGRSRPSRRFAPIRAGPGARGS